jgi:hypothetical protein
MNRLVLATYCVALLMLLLFPFAGPGFRLLGVESDKWMHFALFGGLAVLLRWNLSENRHAVFVAVGAAFVVAAATEVAQGLLAYRSAEFMDLVSTDRILSSTVLQRLLGLIVAVLGLMVGTFFLLADRIGVGDSGQFGPVQIAGLALGVLIAAGGVGVHVKGIRGVSRLS